MKSLLQVGVLVASLSVLAASALAVGPITGTWHGHAKADLTKVHQPKTAAEKSRMVASINKVQKSTTTMVLKPDHTFVVAVDNDSRTSKWTGTWKQAGSSLIMDGKATAKAPAKTQIFTISADGKTMSTSFGGIVFTFRR